jgi:hypothetical protein
MENGSGSGIQSQERGAGESRERPSREQRAERRERREGPQPGGRGYRWRNGSDRDEEIKIRTKIKV